MLPDFIVSRMFAERSDHCIICRQKRVEITAWLRNVSQMGGQGTISDSSRLTSVEGKSAQLPKVYNSVSGKFYFLFVFASVNSLLIKHQCLVFCCCGFQTADGMMKKFFCLLSDLPKPGSTLWNLKYLLSLYLKQHSPHTPSSPSSKSHSLLCVPPSSAFFSTLFLLSLPFLF